MEAYAGIDLGGTNIKVGLFSTDLKLLDQSSCRTEVEKGFHRVIGQMASAVQTLCERSGVALKELRSVGIGCPGPVDTKSGLVVVAPNFPGWRDLPVRDSLKRALGGVPTVLENDANVAAYGEFRAGVGQGVGSLAMITLGTGIGCGIVIDSRIHRGVTDTAGELGHVIVQSGGRQCGCGRHGCLETYASATGTVRRFREALATGRSSMVTEGGIKEEDITAKDIFEAAANGDALAWEIVDETVRYLAIGCDVMVNLVDPDIIVLTGGMTAAGDLLMKPLEKYAREMFFPRPKAHTRLALTALGGDAGIIGAGFCAQDLYETSAS
ncbi:MAG: ROK family protein [Planctomycetes bacterium]|nr:ROK family protein [Planctomycetota bacterium]